MTCIVGLVDNHQVLIGGDSAGIAGYDITARADTKVFTRKPYIFGFTSSYRMGQLLRYSVELPIPDPTATLEELDGFMVVSFIEAVRTAMTAGGYTTIRNNSEDGGTFLTGINGRLYAIHSDWQIGRAHDGYMSVGCGSDLALGSLHTTRPRTGRNNVPARTRITTALAAAAHHSAGVCGPFKVVAA